MKMKSILATAALGLVLGSVASATTPAVIVHIAGSTAFRGNTHNAILHAFDSHTATVAFDSASSLNYVGFRGTMLSKDTLIVCAWSGSEAGLEGVARHATTVTFPSADAVTAKGVAGVSSMPSSAASLLVAGDLTDVTYPDVAMADNWQKSSAKKYVKNGTYAQLKGADNTTDGIVGVVPFKWLASHGATITGLTTKQANAIYGSFGFVPESLITGVSGSANWVYGIGRDINSGTRLSTAVEMYMGATDGLVQFNPVLTDGTTQATGTGQTIAGLVSTGNVGGLVDNNGGYSSGGTMCKVLWNSAPANTTIIGYSGQGDADKAGQGIDGGAGAVELAWNGVTLGSLSANWNLIAEGKYTFWSYEHMYINTSYVAIGTDIQKAAARIAGQIKTGAVTGTPDAPHPYLSEMKVQRSADGGSLSSNVDTSLIPFQ